jgi:hypothetical protein
MMGATAGGCTFYHAHCLLLLPSSRYDYSVLRHKRDPPLLQLAPSRTTSTQAQQSTAKGSSRAAGGGIVFKFNPRPSAHRSIPSLSNSMMVAGMVVSEDHYNIKKKCNLEKIVNSK